MIRPGGKRKISIIFSSPHQINNDKINTTANPLTELTNSNNPQVLNVCPIDRLKVSFIIQNAASLGIVMVLLPTAVANMSNVGLTLNTGINGATMPAAVMAETAP